MQKVYITNSRVHGRGVHAARDIKKGETIFLIKGKPVRLVIHSQKDSKIGPHWVGIKRHHWIDPVSPASFLNHSCNPNAGIRGSVTLKAMKKISKGEEIVFDYSTTEEDRFWTLSCRCGESNCRKKVQSIQTLPRAVFKRYLPFIPTYFQKVYLRYNKMKGKR